MSGAPRSTRLGSDASGPRRAGQGRPLHLAAGWHSVAARWLVTVYILLLLLVPAVLTVPALGAAGTPALMVGLLGLAWWLGARILRSPVPGPAAASRGIRWALFAFTVVALASYVVATVRPIDGIELTAADRGLLMLASWLGIALVTADGLGGREVQMGTIGAPADIGRVENLLRVLVAAGGVVAIVGIAQFVTGRALVDTISIPGLSANTTLTSVYDRDGFNRTAGTSTHPIEFGVILAMMLPIALHFAVTDSHRNVFWRWLPAAAIALAVPVTLSRSALVSVLVALVVLLPTWPVRWRRRAYLTLAALAVAIFVLIPGMLGTLSRLFTGISEDSSALSRTDSYALAWEYIQRSPLVGRGLFTFLPEYRILDNQYLGLLIEVGVVGTVAFIALLVVATRRAALSRRLITDPRARSLAQSLTAMISAGALGFATFDALGFAQAAGLLFLGIGFIGAVANSVDRSESDSAGLSSSPTQE